MRKLVSTPEQVASNIRKFVEEVTTNEKLQAVLGLVHAWYAIRLPDNTWAFGPSKFVGYLENTAKRYLATYQATADGRETEQALRPLSTQIDPTSRLGVKLVRALEDFLQQWGRKPRNGARISVVSDSVDMGAVSIRKSDEALLGRISSDPAICGGRPCIKGTRMRVVDIVEAIAYGAAQEELLRDFDYLTADDIAAALLYSARASDHRVIQTV
jgi:uncharacterized protein (DUF433 family)